MLRFTIIGLVLAVALSACSIGQAELVGYWNFDDQTADDVTGSGNDGILQGGATFSSERPAAIGSGYSLTLDGNGDWVRVPDDASGGTLDAIDDTLTVSYWLKGDSTEQTYGWARTIAKILDHATAEGAGWNYETGGNVDPAHPETNPTTMISRIRTDGANWQGTSPMTLLDGDWHHVALVLDRGDWWTYRDGSLINSGTYAHGNGFGTPRDLSFGADLGSRPFTGQLDDISIWNEAVPEWAIAAMADGVPATAIPEPSTLVLLTLGCLALGWRRRR